MWGIFFGEFQCLPVNDCSAVSCDSGALTRGSERTSFYSAILNQSPETVFLKSDLDPMYYFPGYPLPSVVLFAKMKTVIPLTPL